MKRRRREEATTTKYDETRRAEKNSGVGQWGSDRGRKESGKRPSGSRHRESCRAFRGGKGRFTLRATISA